MIRRGLSDRQWQALLEKWPQRRGPRCEKEDRCFVEAVVWLLRTGSPWRDLDSQFGSWKRIYNRFRRWSIRGWWTKLFESSSVGLGVEGTILDASIVRAHQDASGGFDGPKAQAIGRSRGGFSTKLHAAATLDGQPLCVFATPGQQHEVTVASRLLDSVRGDYCLADGGYDADAFLNSISERGMQAVIPARATRRVKRQLNTELYRLRYRVEVFFHRLKRNRRIATRYEKTLRCFMGFLHFACFLICV